MAIRVYNTLSKTKEAFETVEPGKVGIYLCGPTVYKPSHIGHMVGPVIFDAIKRYLTYRGYEVTLVVNITDVDDKLIAESSRRGMPMSQLAQEMTADYFQNLEDVGVDTIDQFPKATEHIDEIVAFTSQLVDRGYAYVSGGDVYFDVARDSEYGKLSHRGRDALQGEGGEMADRKRAPGDFALWKGAKPGEPAWDSPWGRGRPGWHIECSAMSRKLLGETFDIHGGGLDLVFPHHENEIAQSECCHGKPQARYWMHNGLMQASHQVGKLGGRNTREAIADDPQAQEAGKMGKSKGASAFRDLLKQFRGETIRFFLLSTHYRSPIDYGIERLAEVERSLDAFYRCFSRTQRILGQSFYELTPAGRRELGELAPGDDQFLAEVATIRGRFLESMDDDFNTGAAIGDLFDLVRAINRQIELDGLENASRQASAEPRAEARLRSAMNVLRELTAVLGLFLRPPEAPSVSDDGLAGKLIELLVKYRTDARKNKHFALADQVRNDLAALGVALEDRQDGTQWTIQKG